MQQGVQTDATCNIQQCWQLLVNNISCLDLLCAVIWKIVELFLETSIMPNELKQAVTRPLLKKPSLDYQEFKKLSVDF